MENGERKKSRVGKNEREGEDVESRQWKRMKGKGNIQEWREKIGRDGERKTRKNKDKGKAKRNKEEEQRENGLNRKREIWEGKKKGRKGFCFFCS